MNSPILVRRCLAGLLLLVAPDLGASPPLVTLGAVQRSLGFTNYVWDGDSVTLSNSTHVIRFYQGRRKADVDGTAVWLNLPPDGAIASNAWRLAKVDLDFLAVSLLPAEESKPRVLRVLIDPGHGGSDTGALNKRLGLCEKNITLSVAKRLGACLSTNSDFKVFYTRKRDSLVSLEDRVHAAHQEKADLFVSIHVNYAGNLAASGVETFVTQPPGYAGTTDMTHKRWFQVSNANDFNSTLLGYEIQRSLADNGTNTVDRGLKRQAYYVLREIGCPAALTEIGFLSNEADIRRMTNGVWQAACAEAIARGIRAYARKVTPLNHRVLAKRQREHPLPKPAPSTNTIPVRPQSHTNAVPAHPQSHTDAVPAHPQSTTNVIPVRAQSHTDAVPAHPQSTTNAASYSRTGWTSASTPTPNPTPTVTNATDSIFDFYASPSSPSK